MRRPRILRRCCCSSGTGSDGSVQWGWVFTVVASTWSPPNFFFSGVFSADFFNGVFGRGVEFFFLCSGAARFCPSPAAARPIRDSAREVEGKINSPDTRAPTPDRRQPVLSDTPVLTLCHCALTNSTVSVNLNEVEDEVGRQLGFLYALVLTTRACRTTTLLQRHRCGSLG